MVRVMAKAAGGQCHSAPLCFHRAGDSNPAVFSEICAGGFKTHLVLGRSAFSVCLSAKCLWPSSGKRGLERFSFTP